METTTKIGWNGCDGYKVSDESVFTQSEEFKPFQATEIQFSDIPLDEDGDHDFDGIFVTECGRFFK